MKSNVADNDMEVFRLDKHGVRESRMLGGFQNGMSSMSEKKKSEVIVMLAPQKSK